LKINSNLVKNYLLKHPFAPTGFFIFPILVLAFFMEFYLPSNAPEGYKSFIVAFEFAKTPAEIQTLFADLSPETIHNIDKANYIDFGFMLAYSLFLSLIFQKAAFVFKRRWLLWGVLLSVFIFIADFAENVVLLNITKIYRMESGSDILLPTLNNLRLFTWLKWSGLAIAFVLFFFGMKKNTGIASFTGAALLIPAILAPWAFHHNPVAETWFVFSVFGGFAALFILAFGFQKERLF
jgi:hypothetical protein